MLPGWNPSEPLDDFPALALEPFFSQQRTFCS